MAIFVKKMNSFIIASKFGNEHRINRYQSFSKLRFPMHQFKSNSPRVKSERIESVRDLIRRD